MKDYKDQIRSVIIANFRLNTSSSPEIREIPGLAGMSGAVAQINRMIQSEVSSLESEIVNLTEQMLEYDTLMNNTKHRASHQNTFPVARHRRQH